MSPEHVRKDDIVLELHIKEEMERYSDIITRLSTIEEKLGNIENIWTQSKGALAFLKIVATIAGSLVAIYLFITSNFSIVPK